VYYLIAVTECVLFYFIDRPDNTETHYSPHIGLDNSLGLPLMTTVSKNYCVSLRKTSPELHTLEASIKKKKFRLQAEELHCNKFDSNSISDLILITK
jgi:hypothetical protein